MATERSAAAEPAAETSNLDTVARLGAQRRKFKDAAKRLADERDAEKAKVAELEKKLADAEKAGGAEKIAALEAKLKEQSHRAKFDELAKEAGVNPKALNDLYEKSGYRPEGEPDPAKIKAAIEAQKTERDYLFQPAAQEGQAAEGAGQIVPGPGRGQGGTAANQNGVFAVTQEQLRNPQWMMANQAKIAAAAQEALNLPVSQVASKFAIL